MMNALKPRSLSFANECLDDLSQMYLELCDDPQSNREQIDNLGDLIEWLAKYSNKLYDIWQKKGGKSVVRLPERHWSDAPEMYRCADATF